MKYLKYVFLIVGTILAIFPFYWMILTAFSQHAWVSSIFSISFSWESISSVLINHPFGRWSLNTLIVAGTGTCGNMLFASLAAFAFSCLIFKGRDFLFYLLLSTMVIPGFLVLIPRFFIISNLGWINTYQGVFIIWWFQVISVFLLRQYFLSMPLDSLNAARVDGANLWQIFWHIVVPIAKPVLLALFVITFLRDWNMLMWPMVIVRSTEMQTLQVGMSEFYDFYQADYGKIMAGGLISLLPILGIFIVFQKYVEKGIRMKITL